MSEPTLNALERAKRLTNKQLFTIDLQIRRIRSVEPEDEEFIFRWWADIQFLIIALWRARQAALIARGEPSVREALRKFDDGLPGLKAMRDVGEHIDAYVVDSKRRHDKTTQMLEVGTWDDPVFEWLDETLDVEKARGYAYALYSSIHEAFKARIASSKPDAAP